MKSILILGGYGFLGSNIIKYVDKHLSAGYSFIVADRLNHHPYGISFCSVTQTYCGDLSDANFLETIFNENKIDIVVHSYSATIPAIGADPLFDIETNLIAAVKLLEIMNLHNVKDLIYISSGGAVYGESSTPHRETEDPFPISSYGIVKLAIEKYIMQYAKLYDFRPLILRLSNPYGPYHYSTKQGICNVAFENALKKKILEIWGDGKARKDFIFVEDFVKILFLLIKKQVHTQVINIASGQVFSVNQILSSVKGMIPSFRWEYHPVSIFDVQHSILDNTKLLSIIGGFQFTKFKDGLKQTFLWEKKKI